MRFTSSILASFIAVSVATPGSPAYKPDPATVSHNSLPVETTPIDGDWHIGCNENNHCSYYQGKDPTPDSTVKKFARSIVLSESTCQPCDSEHACHECYRDCHGCVHYKCDEITTGLSVCMSLRAKWQPPGFNISVSGTWATVPSPTSQQGSGLHAL